METALEMAKGTSNAQLAVAFSKEAIERGQQADMDTAIEIEANFSDCVFATQDQKEEWQLFLKKKKRKPVFTKK